MTPRTSLPRRTWREALLLAAFVWLAVMAVFGRWTWADWSTPHWFEGDPLEVYLRVQIAAEQPVHALTSFTHPARLGAPFGADWSGYAVPDRLVFVATGLISRGVGLVAAVQLVSALGFVANALSFFLCARWLGRRWEWAAAFALGFAFCNYNLRWGITLSLAQTFTLPPLVLLCAHAAGRGSSPIRRNWIVLAVALGAWLGLGNPYLAFFAGVVAGGGLVLALARRASPHRLAPLLIFLGVLTFVFVAANFGYALAHWRGSESGALTRDLSDFTRYALRPAEWFVPPADHRLASFGTIGRDYAAARGAGEFFYNYLGLVGAVGLGWLLLASLRRFGRAPLRQAALIGLSWLVVFGLAHGVNSWLGALGLDVFRASTRLGIFAAIWVSFFLVGRIQAFTLHIPRTVSIALAAIVAAFLVWEQTPDLARRAPREANAARATAYRELATKLEADLPAGALVFQMPAAPFPEAGRIAMMPDYEHALPFLSTTTLRFSYGHLRTAAAHRWERHVARLSALEMIAALQRAGFSALWVDRRGFPDQAVPLVATLRAAGLRELSVPAELPLNVFQLTPAATPSLPDLADPRLRDPWDDPASPTASALYTLGGWYPLEREGDRRWRWAAHEARMSLWHEGSARTVRLAFAAGGRTKTSLRLLVNGAEIWRAPLLDGPAALHEVTLAVQPGANALVWILDGRTFRPGHSDPRELGFMIENPRLSAP